MKKSGGIVSLIAGIFGIFASIFTIMSGGLVGALETAGEVRGDAIIGMGFWGILLSFIVIVFGALALNSGSRRNGFVLMAASVLGVYFGGNLVAICMFLSLIGGLLVTLGTGKKIED